MRTSNKMDFQRNRQDDFGDRRQSGRDYDRSGMEDSYRNEDYYSDIRNGNRGFENRDYDNNNFWGNRDRELRRQDRGEDYVPSVNYGREDTGRRYRTSGYGNQNSRFMNEFDEWRNGSRNNYDYRPDEEMGYAGRNSNDYRNGYGDQDYYSPSDDDRGGWRRSPQVDSYGQYGRDNERYRASGRQHDGRNGSPDYNYYESYPSYGQGAPYNDHERGYIDKQEARGNRGIDNEDDYSYSRRDDSGERRRFTSAEFARQRRPMIRNKRY